MTPHTVTAPGRRPRRHSDLHLTLASIAAGVALLLAGTYPMSVGAQVGGGGTQVGVSPEAGPPYPWEAGVMVSPYSTANLFNGNVLTAIQLVEPLESVGVPFRLTLYHNSAGASGSLTPPQGALFPIGSGWNITFGGCVIDQTAQNKMYVIEDDGLVKLFNWNGSQWVPPTGVHERLERDDMGTPSDPGDDHWVLTRKDQRQRVFSANGLLIEERSSNLQFGGLPAPMYREPDSKYISKIAVWPDYNVDPLGGLFWSITYPANSTDPINIRLRTKELWARQIRLSRNEQGRLDKVEWLDEQQEAGPPAVYAHVELTYDSAGRIQTIRDKNGNTYTYAYDTLARIYTVTAPSPLSSQVQQFTYSFYPPSKWKTVYRDRRSKNWTFIFESWGGLSESWNPAPFTAQKRRFSYDSNRNRTTFINELNNTWTATYDSSGNLLTLTNPLNQKSTLTYDGYNNLRTVDPPLDSSGASDTSKRVELVYNDRYPDPETGPLADATHLTSIIEPADGVSNPAATTALTWNHDFRDAPGRIASLEDANGVRTEWDYVMWEYVEYGYAVLKLSYLRYEGIDPPGEADHRVPESFLFFEGPSEIEHRTYYRSHSFTGHHAGGTMMHNEPASSACGSGLSLGNLPSDHDCNDCPPMTGLPCWQGNSVQDPPPSWPLSSDPVCHLPIDPASCHVTFASDCGATCIDFMYQTLRERWPRASVHTPSTSLDAADRILESQYDSLGRRTSFQTRSSIPTYTDGETVPDYGPYMDRTFVLTPDGSGNLDLLTDANGSTTDYVYDEANRLNEITVDGQTVVAYTLNAAGWPTLAAYANGASTFWTYDAAGRVDLIEHKLGATNLLTLDYHFTADGLISSIDQSDASGSYTMSYSYDKRGRLIHEAGELPPVPVTEGGSGLATAVDLAYTYDQLGNRLSRTDAVAGLTTTYTYDVHDSSYLFTRNNRLLGSVTAPTGGGPAVEKVWYTYTLGGHVKRILRTSDPDGDPETGLTPYTLTSLDYNSDQQLCLIRGYAIEADQFGVSTCLSNVFAREFRYDGGGRRRYWSRERDPDTLTPIDEFGGWREYAGESIYADLSATQDPGNPDAVLTTPERRYLHAADGRLIGWRNAAGDWQFVHADHLGSTRLVTGAGGVVGSRLGYSAFGEVLSSANPGGAAARSRYGYCGGWGYEDDGLENPGDPAYATGLLHVGARYYAPGLGRFVQRDPISLQGGLSCYSYVSNSPNCLIDPTGYDFSLTGTVATAGIGATIGAITAGGAALVAESIKYGCGLPFNAGAIGSAALSGAIAGAGGAIGAGLKGAAAATCFIAGGGLGGLAGGAFSGHRGTRLLADFGVGAGLGALAGWGALSESEQAELTAALFGFDVGIIQTWN